MPRSLAAPPPVCCSLSSRRHEVRDQGADELDAPYRLGEILAALAVTAGGALLVWYGVLVLDVLAGG